MVKNNDFTLMFDHFFFEAYGIEVKNGSSTGGLVHAHDRVKEYLLLTIAKDLFSRL
jgi:hypothetical protein